MRVDLSAGDRVGLVPRLVTRDGRGACVALAAGGALLIGGDGIEVDVTVGDGCTLELVEVGGTVVYRAPGEAADPSTWTVRIRLGRDATLVWRGLDTVITDEAVTHRSLVVDAAAGARALIRERIVLGRSGERGGRMESQTSVTVDDVPLLVEWLQLDGVEPDIAVRGDGRVVESVVLAGLRAPDEPGVLQLAGTGALARHVDTVAHRSPLEPLWERWQSAVLSTRAAEESHA